METVKVGDKIKFVSSTDKYFSNPTSFEGGKALNPGDIGIVLSISQGKELYEDEETAPPERKIISVRWDKEKSLNYRLLVPGDTFEIIS